MTMQTFERVKTALAVIAVCCACLGGMSRAAAQIPDPYPASGSISSVVTQTGPATWQYEFTVHNTSEPHQFLNFGLVPAVYWVLIPYFADAGITDVTCPGGCRPGPTPDGWSWSVSSVGNLGASPGFGNANDPNSKALGWEWTLDSLGLQAGQSLSGFGFTASHAPVKGPFNLRFALGEPVIGDPAIPGSPLAIAAGYTTAFPVTAPIPEADTWAMMLAGLGLLAGFAPRRRTR